ncbi:MAG: manganese-dependent inorganic pyrophosphatase [Rickettsiales bacterium]|jgi:manganese-dependent inorganic pyrophosphatase|nr:manganese-dependent inorganic pyrophosphatase [Rickettsiales bacterium]
MSIIATGHKNPDTDSVISSIAIAHLMHKRGFTDCRPVMQGRMNPETRFVLEMFKLEEPDVMISVKDQDVIIVDTTDTAQLPSDITLANNIIAMVDHHQLGDLTTTSPVEMWVWPVGCTATIIAKMYAFYGFEIPTDIAGGMMSAIISDTVLFKSPTTTPADKMAVENLAKIAGIDNIEEFGMKILMKKSDVENETPIDLLKRDFKDFTMAGKRFGIGQVEVIALSMLDKKRDGLIDEMRKLKEEKNYGTVMLMLTDIMKEGTELLCISDEISIIERAFDKQFENGISMWLDGVMSRKKQIIPPLENVLK